jgi:Domain of unknown function (DUF4397)
MTFSRSIAALLCTVALAACEKNAVQDITGTLPNSGIRFFNFGVNAPSVNFYANERKVTAVLSATGVEAVTGVSYGGVSSGGFYAAIDPAQYTFTGKIAATVDKDLIVSSVNTTLADGKPYSYYISGFYDPVAKTVDAFVVEDNFSQTFDFSVANVRFVNAISNSQPMTLYAKNTTTLTEVPVGAAIAYKGAGAFTPVPGGIYDIATRVGTSATNVISRTAVTFIAGRTYTISSRGDITVVSTTAVNRPQLDNTPNR